MKRSSFVPALLLLLLVLTACDREADTDVTTTVPASTEPEGDDEEVAEDVVTQGEAIYAANCTGCHGSDLGGPVALGSGSNAA